MERQTRLVRSRVLSRSDRATNQRPKMNRRTSTNKNAQRIPQNPAANATYSTTAPCREDPGRVLLD